MNPATTAAAISAANDQLCNILLALPKGEDLPDEIESALSSLFENLGLAIIPSHLHVLAASTHLNSAQENLHQPATP